MKPETLETLHVARRLMDQASQLCHVSDKYTSAAGMVILQDAVELVLLSCLMELGVDQEKNIERWSFDQLIGGLQEIGITVAKSGTLKAMNKQRVLVKHYGQIIEPDTARRYFDASLISVDGILEKTVGKSLSQILISEIIKDEKLREHVAVAERAIAEGKFQDALKAIRQAFYLAVEGEYSVYDFRPNAPKRRGLLSFFGPFSKAPWYSKQPDYFRENIREPFDYIVIDRTTLSLDLLRWGVTTTDADNILSLTPDAFYFSKGNHWIFREEQLDDLNEAQSEEAARYCLDRLISVLVRRQNYLDQTKSGPPSKPLEFDIMTNIPMTAYSKASDKSEVVAQLDVGTEIRLSNITYSLDDGSELYGWCLIPPDANRKSVFGFIKANDLRKSEEVGNEKAQAVKGKA